MNNNAGQKVSNTARPAKGTIQDNVRESQQIELYRLVPGIGRIGVDAFDESGNPFELKTTSKGGVSTARDLGPRHIEKWRSRYWIITNGIAVDKVFHPRRHFFLAPQHMEGWYSLIMARFEADMALSKKVVDLARGTLSDEQISKVEKLLYDGMLLNDPNIPWSFVEKNGIEITDDHADTLRRLVAQHPLAGSASV